MKTIGILHTSKSGGSLCHAVVGGDCYLGSRGIEGSFTAACGTKFSIHKRPFSTFLPFYANRGREDELLGDVNCPDCVRATEKRRRRNGS